MIISARAVYSPRKDTKVKIFRQYYAPMKITYADNQQKFDFHEIY